jgi:L-fucose/D-arabinose isomerase
MGVLPGPEAVHGGRIIMKRSEQRARMLDNPPIIGIRPTIDSRRKGVREALEEKTMELAKAVAELIQVECKTIDGKPVKTLIAQGTIGCAKESTLCERTFDKAGVTATLTVTPSWCYPTETMELNPQIPRAIWGFNGTQRPGAVYLAALTGAYDQFGLPIFKIYGRDIQDLDDDTVPEDVKKKILLFVRGAVTLGTMKGHSYLSLGGVSMGIASSIVNPYFLFRYFGMRTEYVDMSELSRRIEKGIFSKQEYQDALSWVKKKLVEMEDPNPERMQEERTRKEDNWETSIKMALIVKDLMGGNPALAEMDWIEEAEGHYALAAGFQGQRQWTDYRPTGDFMEAMLNSSFDWSGIRRPYIVATENDSLNAISMLLGHLITGKAQLFADVRTYWSPTSIRKLAGAGDADRLDKELPVDPLKEGFIYLTNSGAAALDGSGVLEGGVRAFWDLEEADVEKLLGQVRWGSAKLWTFRGGGFSSSFSTISGLPFTMVRLNLVSGKRPVIQLAEGYSVRFSPKVEQEIIDRTDPTWPKTFFVPLLEGRNPVGFSDTYGLMERWGANHCSLCYGHVGDQLITLASMARIPVVLHNVQEERIFRPSYWNTYGPPEAVATDSRVCEFLGPLYGSMC